MKSALARTGYTLPVFAVAAAKAALLHLQDAAREISDVELDLLPERATISIAQVAGLDDRTALAVTYSDPGDNLDLTRHTPVWAWVQLSPRGTEPLILEAGEGVGRTAAGEPAIYAYARRLFAANLQGLLPDNLAATVRVILPRGRLLAKRTANEAFGVLEGLSLLGTSGISQPHTAADRLAEFRQQLQEKAQHRSHLALCIGHNGQRLAARLGVGEAAIVQGGNWLGALLVEAGLLGVASVLLLGYHGKLLKLAGGIFNTSSHIADAKLEILASTVAIVCDDIAVVRGVLAAETAEAAEKDLQSYGIARQVFDRAAENVSDRARAYIQKYADTALEIGTILSDRQGEIVGADACSREVLARIQGSDGG